MFIFTELTKNVKLKAKDVYVDNMVFRLHYRLTFWFLMACTAVVCTRQYIGDHIDCIADKALENVINTFCFFMTTYTIVEHHNYTQVSRGFAIHPGVGPDHPGYEVKRHSYYQWVPFALFTQALLFYLPHYIWRNVENGRVKVMVEGMRRAWLTAPEDDLEINGYKIDSGASKTKKVTQLKNSLMLVHRFGINRDWARTLVFTEMLNVVNIVIQIYLTDVFLGGRFLTLGYDWLATDSESELLDQIFPKVTKCTFRKYGASGSIQKHDAMCIMALNIMNEKIYCILWFWFCLLFVVTCAGLVWRVLTFLLHSISPPFNRLVWGQISPGPPLDSADIRVITRTFCFSDWLFLYYVGKNIDGMLFRGLVRQVADELRSPFPSTSSSPYPSLYPRIPDGPEAKLLTLDQPDKKSAGESNC